MFPLNYVLKMINFEYNCCLGHFGVLEIEDGENSHLKEVKKSTNVLGQRKVNTRQFGAENQKALRRW